MNEAQEIKFTELLHQMEDLEIVMLCRFGSHLYGTDNPGSDLDFKGIYMPTRRQILTGKFPNTINLDTNKGNNSKNTSDDIDCELYSLHYFLDMLSKGEMISMDMIHATGEEDVLLDSDIWNTLRNHRSMFYTTEMKGFVGYARKQAAKYGDKGARLEAAKQLREFLECRDPDSRMMEHWWNLPEGDHLKHMEQPAGGVAPKFLNYNFCGKIVQSTVKVSYVLDMLDSFEKGYGDRAKKAQKSGGNDWKAVSHALRASYQILEIMQTGDLMFPIKNAEYVRAVKNGEVAVEEAQAELDRALDEVEVESVDCPFPAKVDTARVLDLVEDIVLWEHFNGKS